LKSNKYKIGGQILLLPQEDIYPNPNQPRRRFDFDELEGIVESDSKKAIDKECGYINGKLYYGFYQFKPANGKYRYIFYRNSSLRDDEPDEVTIVYMEGYPTLEELKKMFR
jgi:hypothetical protein